MLSFTSFGASCSFDADTGTLTCSKSGDDTEVTWSNVEKALIDADKEINDIKEIVIGDGITSIGEYTFVNCDELENITISDNVTSIGDYAFAVCSKLTSVKFGDNSQLKTIGEGAFYYCSGLKSITIPNTVTSIGNKAFEFCYGLTNVTFGDNSLLETIGDDAFNDCMELTSMTFGYNSQLKTIGKGAFCNCHKLENIEIPNTVTSIGEYAFSVCSGLTDVYYTGTETKWNNLINGEDGKYFGYGNENLTSATIHYSKILTLKKKWKDGGDGSKRGIPQFVLEKTLNSKRTELKEGLEADGGDYIELSCTYNDGASDVFGIDSNGEKKITKGAKGVDTWVYKFIVYDYDDKAKYAVEEEPMEGYKSEAFKEKQGS